MARKAVIWLMVWLLLPGWALAKDKAQEEDFAFAVLGDTRPIAHSPR